MQAGTLPVLLTNRPAAAPLLLHCPCSAQSSKVCPAESPALTILYHCLLYGIAVRGCSALGAACNSRWECCNGGCDFSGDGNVCCVRGFEKGCSQDSDCCNLAFECVAGTCRLITLPPSRKPSSVCSVVQCRAVQQPVAALRSQPTQRNRLFCAVHVTRQTAAAGLGWLTVCRFFSLIRQAAHPVPGWLCSSAHPGAPWCGCTEGCQGRPARPVSLSPLHRQPVSF